MRPIFVLIVLGSLAGCSMLTAVPDAWNWDPASRPVVARTDASANFAPSIRVTDLRMQRQEIRTRIAAEPDIRQRQVLYAQLHAIGGQLSPLERQPDFQNLAR